MFVFFLSCEISLIPPAVLVLLGSLLTSEEEEEEEGLFRANAVNEEDPERDREEEEEEEGLFKANAVRRRRRKVYSELTQ